MTTDLNIKVVQNFYFSSYKRVNKCHLWIHKNSSVMDQRNTWLKELRVKKT